MGELSTLRFPWYTTKWDWIFVWKMGTKIYWYQYQNGFKQIIDTSRFLQRLLIFSNPKFNLFIYLFINLYYFWYSSDFIHHCGLRNTRSLLKINTSRRHTQRLFTRHKDASKIEGDDESTKIFILTFFTSSSLYDEWSTFW